MHFGLGRSECQPLKLASVPQESPGALWRGWRACIGTGACSPEPWPNSGLNQPTLPSHNQCHWFPLPMYLLPAYLTWEVESDRSDRAPWSPWSASRTPPRTGWREWSGWRTAATALPWTSRENHEMNVGPRATWRVSGIVRVSLLVLPSHGGPKARMYPIPLKEVDNDNIFWCIVLICSNLDTRLMYWDENNGSIALRCKDRCLVSLLFSPPLPLNKLGLLVRSGRKKTVTLRSSDFVPRLLSGHVRGHLRNTELVRFLHCILFPELMESAVCYKKNFTGKDLKPSNHSLK